MFNFNNKRILITGNTGFKGSWLSFWLNELGAEVIGYSLKPYTNPNLFDILNLKDKIIQIYADIRDIDILKNTVEKYKPEFIFHLAAQPLVRDSYDDPKYTFEVNVMGTVNILEIIKKYDFIRGAIIVTTDKVYENRERIYPYRENDRLGGFDPYSTSKAMCELVVSGYNNSFFQKQGKKVVTVRAGNVIGGGDWSKDRLIPDIMRALFENKKLVIRNPDAIRPWQYVLDGLYGYLILAKKMFESDKYLGNYNFAPEIDDMISVKKILKIAKKYFNNLNYEIVEDDTKHEAQLLLLDNTKAKLLLGWKAKYNINYTLDKTFEFYRIYYSGGNIIKFAKNEILQYKI